MNKINYIFCFLAGVAMLSSLSSCSEEELRSTPDVKSVHVRFELNNDVPGFTKAPGDAALSVNRILILPFRKTSEGVANDAINFLPEYSTAKQLDVNNFPVISTKLNLTANVSYQLMVIGYNQNDFDFANQGSSSRRFSIGPTTGATLANFYLQPVSPVDVPELFTCAGTGYKKELPVSTIFTTSQIDKIQGNLTRMVSGLTMSISNIPDFVTSISLEAEQLVTASIVKDGSPSSWQTSGDTGIKVLGNQIPIAGSVTFNKYVLPTLNARKTLLYLNVSYGSITERYTTKVPDSLGVSSSNRITFTPNNWVRITGDYTKINLGFKFTDDINLDDNNWDGLQ